MSVWRLQTNTKEAQDAGYCADDCADYCIKNNVAALGFEKNVAALGFEKYELLTKVNSSVNALAKKIQPNDLIWMRRGGKYYLARITNKSYWKYDNSKKAKLLGVFNQRTDVKWIEIGDESDVPGALTTAFIRGHAMQQIKKPGISEYSKLIYDKKAKDDFRYNSTIEWSEENFYSLISPSDCEDLLYIYSYKESNYRYVCIPSTNKIATQKYEFVAIDRETGKHIYYQAKNGNIDLNADDYYKLIENSDSDEVYLLTTEGNVINAEKHERIHVVGATKLFNFCCDDKNKNIIPAKIRCWIEFAGGYNVQSEK